MCFDEEKNAGKMIFDIIKSIGRFRVLVDVILLDIKLQMCIIYLIYRDHLLQHQKEKSLKLNSLKMIMKLLQS